MHVNTCWVLIKSCFVHIGWIYVYRCWCYSIFCPVMLCYVMWCDVMWCDDNCQIWDRASGTLKLSLTGHISAVRGLAVSARHPYLFSVGEDKTVKCEYIEWHVMSCHVVCVLSHHIGCSCDNITHMMLSHVCILHVQVGILNKIKWYVIIMVIFLVYIHVHYIHHLIYSSLGDVMQQHVYGE